MFPLRDRHGEPRVAVNGVRTFGLFRLEILAVRLVNVVLLSIAATYVLIEAVLRLARGDADVDAGPMLVVAILGLVVNLMVFVMLRGGARHSLRRRGCVHRRDGRRGRGPSA